MNTLFWWKVVAFGAAGGEDDDDEEDDDIIVSPKSKPKSKATSLSPTGNGELNVEQILKQNATAKADQMQKQAEQEAKLRKEEREYAELREEKKLKLDMDIRKEERAQHLEDQKTMLGAFTDTIKAVASSFAPAKKKTKSEMLRDLAASQVEHGLTAEQVAAEKQRIMASDAEF